MVASLCSCRVPSTQIVTSPKLKFANIENVTHGDVTIVELYNVPYRQISHAFSPGGQWVAIYIRSLLSNQDPFSVVVVVVLQFYPNLGTFKGSATSDGKAEPHSSVDSVSDLRT